VSSSRGRASDDTENHARPLQLVMNILTFDIEDWFHLLHNESTRTTQQWESYEPRIHENVDRILEVLSRKDQRATFFCLGWIAERYPEVIRTIHGLGHEIGSHSYAHNTLSDQNPEDFKRDVSRSLLALEDVIGEKVRCYRAPGFSLTVANVWAFDCLMELGIEVDCSLSTGSGFYGSFEILTSAQPLWIEHGGRRLKEFPLGAFPVMGKRMIFSGGGYFRLLPYAAVRAMSRNSSYVMAYFHPRDFDPDQPVLSGLTIDRRFRSYVGLSSSLAKLEQFLDDFTFVDIATALNTIDWDHAPLLRLPPPEQHRLA